MSLLLNNIIIYSSYAGRRTQDEYSSITDCHNSLSSDIEILPLPAFVSDDLWSVAKLANDNLYLQ